MSAEAVAKRVPVAVAPRARTVQVGTAFAISGVLMYFGALFGIYLNTRSQFVKGGVDWIPGDVDMQLTAPTIIAWTLVSCSLVSRHFVLWLVNTPANIEMPFKLRRCFGMSSWSCTSLFG